MPLPARASRRAQQGEALIAAQAGPGKGENGRDTTSIKRPVRVLAIKGHVRSEGVMSVVQQGLKAIFHNVADAYVYLDFEGNETLTLRDFQAGIKVSCSDQFGFASPVQPLLMKQNRHSDLRTLQRLSLDVEQQGLSKCAAVIAGVCCSHSQHIFTQAYACASLLCSFYRTSDPIPMTGQADKCIDSNEFIRAFAWHDM